MTILNRYERNILTAMTGKTGEMLVYSGERWQRWLLMPTGEEVATFTVNQLEAAGLIRKSPNTNAARITKLGIAALDEARAAEAVAEAA